jgi:carbamoyl-phosphate synthase large subunit
VAVKEAVLPFARFPGSDVVLGPEMKSTGESMGIDLDFATAYLKAQLGAGVRLPRSGTVLITVRDADKPGVVDVAQRLARLGFRLFATCGTAEVLRRAEVPVTTVAKVEEGSPNVLDLIDQGEIQLLIDTALWADEIAGGRRLRMRALQRRVPYCSRLSIARAIVEAIERQQDWEPSVRPLQSYAQQRPALKLFIRQPLTQSGDESKEIVEGVLQIVEEIGKNGVRFEYLTGNMPLSDHTFRENFEQSQGLPFNPTNFRRYRLGQLRRADAFLYVRTAISGSVRGLLQRLRRAPRADVLRGVEACPDQDHPPARARGGLRCDLSRVRGPGGAARRPSALLPPHCQSCCLHADLGRDRPKLASGRARES